MLKISPAVIRNGAPALSAPRQLSLWWMTEVSRKRRGLSQASLSAVGLMAILAEISVGELIDKITILEIKLAQISESQKRLNIGRELALLTQALNRAAPREPGLDGLRAELKAVNSELWRIEDELREHERHHIFDDQFIALARSVYHTNDRRAALKREINTISLSELIEEKSYAAY